MNWIKNRKTTLGGALAALGTLLLGAGHLSGLKVSQTAISVLLVSGFVLQALGIFVGLLYSADSSTVAAVASQVDENTRKINWTQTALITGRTSPLQPKDIPPKVTT